MRPFAIAAGCLVALALLQPVAASADDLAQEEQRGQALSASLRAGERQCGQLSPQDFELIGEYAMGRYLDDTAAHEAMNAHMTAVMGARGESRMHTALGYRYSGCAGGRAWSWTGPMAGMMRGGGGYRGTGYGPGMMGRYGPGSGADHDDIDGVAAVAMAGMMVVLIGLIGAGFFWLGRRTGGGASAADR